MSQTSPMSAADVKRIGVCIRTDCSNPPTHYVKRFGVWEAECNDHGSTAPWLPPRFKEYGL